MSVCNTAAITRMTKRGSRSKVLEAANARDFPEDMRGVSVTVGYMGRIELRFVSRKSSPYEYLVELPQDVVRRAYAALESVGAV